MTRQTPVDRVRFTSGPDGSIFIDGAPLFVGGREHLEQVVEGLISANRVSLVVTPNVDQVLDLESNIDWRSAFGSADLRVADGVPVVLLARCLGGRDVQRHTGADLLPRFAELAARRRWRIVITGGHESVLHEAATRLRGDHPGADIHVIDFPMITSVSDTVSRSVIEGLHDLRPHVVFVCLGSPKQELWIDRWRPHLPAGIYIGAGAAVDFAAGVKLRAPRLAQKLGAEWVWRVAQEPRRLAARYFVKGPRFLAVAARSLVRTHRAPSS